MTMLDWSQCSAVERSGDKMGGAWLFRGTRVPVKSLFDQGTPDPLRRALTLRVLRPASWQAGSGCRTQAGAVE